MSLWSKISGSGGKDRLSTGAGELVWKLIDDENYQNNLLPPGMNELIKNASAVDKIPNGVGAFGLNERNPVPVNGAIGELAYLSRLETVNDERLLFHRIGAVHATDVFEAVTITGTSWHILFVDLYHCRRSRLAPDGFRVGERRQFSGFHTYCPNFPYDFVACKEATPDALRLAYIPLSNVVPALEQRLFARPIGHKAKVGIVEGMMTSRTGP
jgi:hypothetical protein